MVKCPKLVKIACLFLFIALFSSSASAINGDIDNDSKVNFNDLSIIAENWLCTCSSPSWCNGADINTDNIVNMQDYAILTANWGKDSSLVGWWKMDSPTPGASTRLVKDYSGYGNDGTMGSSDKWITGGGIDFAGGNWGATQVAFANNGANLTADMGLTDQVTISFIISGHTAGDNGYAFLGWNSAGASIMSMEAPTGDCSHFLTKMGTGESNWMWQAFSTADSRYIFADSDARRLTVTVDFTTGSIVYYLDGIVWGSFTNAVGSFADLKSFIIAKNDYHAYDMNMEDFRIYNRALTHKEVIQLCVEVPATSWNHSPADGNIAAVTPDCDLTLRWSAGKYATSHDVYFGTSYSDVENATHSSPEYKGNLLKYTTYYSLTGLDPNLTYYWRIDEVDSSNIYTGDVLSFSVSYVWLYTFHNNISDLDTDERLCAYTIQGFANRDKARLFFDTKGGNQMVLSTVDAYWVNYLQTSKGCKFGIVNNLRELVQLAKASGFIDGLVLYDPDTLDAAGEVMPALNIASTQNRLPVTADMLAYTSKELQNFGSARCFDGMDTLDIRNTWATHLDAQTDYVNNHLAGTPKTGVCKVHQNFSTFNDGCNFNYGLDYGISKNYFIMDMNPGVTAEKTLYNKVMDYLTKPALVFGDWHDELTDVSAISTKGHYSVLSMCSNLSFWAHVEVNQANLWTRKPTTGKTLNPDKYYVMIQASDGDSMGFEGALKPSGWQGYPVWLDEDRGTTPITWTCQPLSAELWPALTEYYVLTSTPNDTFCTGPSGVGYCQPSLMPNQVQFAAFEEPFLQLTGLQWVEQWWGWSESLWTNIKSGAPSVKCFGHQGTAGGKNHWLDDGTPVAISDTSLWHPGLNPANPANPYNISDPNNIVNHITAFAATRKTPYFITIYDNPVHALLYSKQCQASLPANYELVTVEDFMDLMDQAVHPKPWGTLLTYDDFETSFGNYSTGGSYCTRSYQTGDTYSRLGAYSVRLSKSGTTASLSHTNGIDVATPGYSQIKVTFWYVANGMDIEDSFMLEYYDGSTWNTIKTYVTETDFTNGVKNFRYNVVYINKSSYTFPTNMKLRFRCNANSAYDYVYIDCVRVEAQ
ncbi:MAG TPA: GxGYxYP family putative glycoside hydrolase [Sedimentisphaerales bacterium]|nr:GxGYxYP family putative glycoside hydrolase [Sedimentisphaerales bacterium]